MQSILNSCNVIWCYISIFIYVLFMMMYYFIQAVMLLTFAEIIRLFFSDQIKNDKKWR